MSTATDESEIPGTQRKKHRHDLGHEDHGPKVAAGTTKTIQMLLGLWIALSLLLVIYTIVDGSRPKPPTSAEPQSSSSQ
ncbi:MAG: hypothetical protein H0T46_23760 [Deltaproteobacteria bacterium]|nr:hypothetical protein [Deltaproteobacteria bacterium]